MMYRTGIGVSVDEALADERFRAACDLGVSRGCDPEELPGSVRDEFGVYALHRQLCVYRHQHSGRGLHRDASVGDRSRDFTAHQSCKGALRHGAANFGIFRWFDQINVPTFYDKLLPVPFLNLAVPAIHKLCRGLEKRMRGIDLGATLGARRANYAYMATWITLFIVMSATHFVGPTHPGESVGFWEQACSEGRYNACHNLQTELGISCQDQVGASCLMHGEMLAEGRGHKQDPLMAAQRFGEGCYLGAAVGCDRLASIMQSSGGNDLQPACDWGDGSSCVALGAVYRKGIGTDRDPVRALGLFETACRAGSSRGCGLAGQSCLYATARRLTI